MSRYDDYYQYGSNKSSGIGWTILGLIGALILLISLQSCNGNPGYTYEESDQLVEEGPVDYYSEIDQKGFTSIGEVGNIELIYDVNTKIVYMKPEGYYGYSTLCPYYAENGLPYKYDTATKSLVMINGD